MADSGFGHYPPNDFSPISERPAARLAIDGLVEALKEETENEWRDLAEPYEPAPLKTWPSTLAYVDTHCGGFYGVTTIAAEPGTGKSMLTRTSAIEAAASGEWQVVHFVAEDDYDGYREGFNLYLERNPHAEDCLGNLHFNAVGKGQTPQLLLGTICLQIDYELDCPILVVLDSINSIVNLSGRNYLRSLSDFGLWASHARRISCGNVSFLIASETNKRGEAKGESLRSWSDLYLKMKKKSDHVVEMTLQKTRRTGGEGPLGKYLRKWHEQRFARPDEQTELRLVEGEGF